MINIIKNLFVLSENKEDGQTLIEYALLVLLIAIVVIGALALLGPQISTAFDGFRTTLADLNGGT